MTPPKPHQKEFKLVFERLDLDRDSKIGATDIKTFLEKLGRPTTDQEATKFLQDTRSPQGMPLDDFNAWISRGLQVSESL